MKKNTRSHTQSRFLLTPLVLAIAALTHSITASACYTDPLLIKLGKGKFTLGEPGVGVFFDFDGDGNKVHTQWVAPDSNEAFLFRDYDMSGVVDNGLKLFGNHTVLRDGSGIVAHNGFVALAQFDSPLLGGNDDGFISAEDVIWNELKLWIDINADGISTEDEVFSLESFGITKIWTIPREQHNTYINENHVPLWGWVEAEVPLPNGKTRTSRFKMADVFFAPLPQPD